MIKTAEQELAEKQAERIDIFKTFMGDLASPVLLNNLVERGFFTAPASTKFHGAYEGGLFDHSLAVAKHLVDFTWHCNLKWMDNRSPFIIGMFHDICKMDQYRHPAIRGDYGEDYGLDLRGWEYNPDTLFKGHGEKSVMLLSQFYILTEEEVACIRYHMGAFTPKEEWPAYTNAVHCYPNVLWTHQADMLAAHVDMT